MDILIEAQKLPDLAFSPMAGIFLLALVVSIALFIAGFTSDIGGLVVIGAIGFIICFSGSMGGAVEGGKHKEKEARASMMDTISDQYEISSLARAGDDLIAACTPGSPADNKPYAWASANPDTLHEGVLLKTAEVDGECRYTLYPKTITTPPLGG